MSIIIIIITKERLCHTVRRSEQIYFNPKLIHKLISKVNNQFATLNRKNAQYFSLDILPQDNTEYRKEYQEYFLGVA